MTTKGKLLGILALLGASFIGGAVGVYAVKVARENLEPFSVVFFRFSFAVPLFLLIYSSLIFSEIKKVGLRNLFKVFLLSILWFFNVSLFSWGIKYTTGIASQLCYTLTPVFILIIGGFFLKETISRRQIIGMIIAFIGVIFLIWKSKSLEVDVLHSLGTLHGNMIILSGVACWSSYLIFSRKLSRQFSGKLLTFFSLMTCSLLSLPLMILESKNLNFLLAKLDNRTVMALIILAIFPSILMLSLQQYALSKFKAFYSGYTAFLGPFFASIVGVSLFGEKITNFLVTGFILILGGSFLVVSRQLKNLKDGLVG